MVWEESNSWITEAEAAFPHKQETDSEKSDGQSFTIAHSVTSESVLHTVGGSGGDALSLVRDMETPHPPCGSGPNRNAAVWQRLGKRSRSNSCVYCQTHRTPTGQCLYRTGGECNWQLDPVAECRFLSHQEKATAREKKRPAKSFGSRSRRVCSILPIEQNPAWTDKRKCKGNMIIQVRRSGFLVCDQYTKREPEHHHYSTSSPAPAASGVSSL